MGFPQDDLEPLIHWIAERKSENVNLHLSRFMVLLVLLVMFYGQEVCQAFIESNCLSG